MYGIIQLSNVTFSNHVKNMTTGKDTLSKVDKPKLDLTSDSKVIELYTKQFEELDQLVKSYISLLEADIKLISETGEELSRTDNALGQSLSSGLQ